VSDGRPADPAAAPRILISGWAGAGNVGDELLARAAIAMVRQAGGIPVVASRDPAATAALHRVEAVAWGPRGLAAAARFDGVCVGPGGIIQDSTSIWSLPGHLATALTARVLGRPVIGLGLGAEPLQRRSSRWMLRGALGGRPVTVRDRPSAEALAAAGVGCEVAPDLTFALDLEPRAPSDELVVAVGPEADSGWLSTASWRLARDSAGAAGEAHAVAAALDRLSVRNGLRVVFVAFGGERDRRHAQRVAAAMDQPSTLDCGPEADPAHASHASRFRVGVPRAVTMAKTAPAVDAAVARVLGAAAVVTSRYHAAVVALCGGVPVTVISAQAKLAALAASVDDPGRIRMAEGWMSLEAAPGRLDLYRPGGGHNACKHALAELARAAQQRRSAV